MKTLQSKSRITAARQVWQMPPGAARRMAIEAYLASNQGAAPLRTLAFEALGAADPEAAYADLREWLQPEVVHALAGEALAGPDGGEPLRSTARRRAAWAFIEAACLEGMHADLARDPALASEWGAVGPGPHRVERVRTSDEQPRGLPYLVPA